MSISFVACSEEVADFLKFGRFWDDRCRALQCKKETRGNCVPHFFFGPEIQEEVTLGYDIILAA